LRASFHFHGSFPAVPKTFGIHQPKTLKDATDAAIKFAICMLNRRSCWLIKVFQTKAGGAFYVNKPNATGAAPGPPWGAVELAPLIPVLSVSREPRSKQVSYLAPQ
jgi:hypothetical protein